VRCAAALLAAALALAGCDRETRLFSKAASPEPAPQVGARNGDLRPGDRGEGLTETQATRTFDGRNAYDASQGRQLFHWYNCAGCHSNGGGGMGPALMDDRWLYGHEPDDIYKTIMEGRPNGMPSFKGRIPNDQVWQLVAYVRLMGGLAPREIGSARGDDLPGGIPGESRRPKQAPIPDPGKAKEP
jgi:cytochrome c oxidase cbb3-type subunit 3